MFLRPNKPGLSIEERQIKMLLKSGNKKIKAKEQLDFTAYFTYEFYPCSPECKNAQLIGTSILERLETENIHLAEAFRQVVELNAIRILNPCLDSEENHILKRVTRRLSKHIKRLLHKPNEETM